MRPPILQLVRKTICSSQRRGIAQGTGTRHLLSIAELRPDELTALVRRAAAIKEAVKSGNTPKELSTSLVGQTVAMMFSKRSTRTRVSTEAAVTLMGGHPMFLGKDDIQLGVNETVHDTSRVISSMTSCMVARVDEHEQVTKLAKDSSVPVINALSDAFHPLQAIADVLTLHEEFRPGPLAAQFGALLPANLKIAWVGDANNVLFDLALACTRLGAHVAVATPRGYGVPANVVGLVRGQARASPTPGFLTLHVDAPRDAVRDADVIVTDTWVSMGQEADAAKRLKDFDGYQVTSWLAATGGAKPGWRFMHCLPRHPEEVSDEVFFSPRSLVFREAENRLWAAVAVLEAFVVNKGKIV